MLESRRFRLIEWLHVNYPGIWCRTGLSFDPIPELLKAGSFEL
jgi:hypothetical protein